MVPWFAALLAVLMLVPLPLAAEPEPLTPCTAEPTNMTINYGDVVECAIDAAGDTDLFRFDGTAGTVVILSLRDGSANTLSSYPRPVGYLYEPGSTTPMLTTPAGTSSQTVELPVSGQYTIRVTENGNDQPEVYRIGLERLFPTSPTASSLPWDSVNADEVIAPTPDQDFYTFEGVQGSFINLVLVDRTANTLSSYPRPYAYLFAPDETLVITLGPGTASADVTLTQDGLYTVHVSENGNDQDETYNLGLQCIFPPPGQDTCSGTLETCDTCEGLAVTICGTGGDDILIGTSETDVIDGREGHDYIDGAGGNDVICAGAGRDTVMGGDGDDHIYGEAGDDVLVGENGKDWLYAGPGRDTLFGNLGRDRLRGDGGDDVLVGGADTDVLQGGTGLNDLCDLETIDSAFSSGCELQLDP